MTSGILPALTDTNYYSEFSGSCSACRAANFCFILQRFSLHAGNAVGCGRLLDSTAFPVCLLISRTLCLIMTMAISDDSGVIYTLSPISWCLLYIAATVSYCAAVIGKITHCRHSLSWIVARVQPCQWQRRCGGATGERLPLDRWTQVTFALESTNLGCPGICSPWRHSCKWRRQWSC